MLPGKETGMGFSTWLGINRGALLAAFTALATAEPLLR
jgi:hypothetical protein